MDGFDVWKTYPGGKIVVEEEYRGKEGQTRGQEWCKRKEEQREGCGRKVGWRER